MGKAAGQEVKEEVDNNRLSDLWTGQHKQRCESQAESGVSGQP